MALSKISFWCRILIYICIRNKYERYINEIEHS